MTINKCPYCEKSKSLGDNFCRNCGNDLRNIPEDRTCLYPYFLFGIAVFVLLTVIEFTGVFVYFPKIIDCTEGMSLCLQFYITGTNLVWISGNTLKMYWIGIIILELTCFMYAVLCYLTDMKAKKMASEDTALHGTVYMFSLILFISMLYSLVCIVLNCLPDTSWMDSYSNEMMILMLSEAGAYEELIYRVVVIGLPMAVIGIAYHKDIKCVKYIFGGFGMNRIALMLLIIQAALFGYAHLTGWGWSKVPVAMFTGVILGYIFIRWGLYASIMAHASLDLTVAAQYILPIPEALLVVVLMFLGLLALLDVCVRHPFRDICRRGMKDMPPMPLEDR